MQLLSEEHLHVLSIGGGPGFDSVALVLLADFFGSRAKITHEIVDLELGWADVVHQLGLILPGSIGRTSSTARVTFRQGDFLSDLSACERPNVVNLFVFPWVISETIAGLRALDFQPLRLLFSAARVGAGFVFLDATDRFWPEIINICRQHGSYDAFIVYSSHKTSIVLNKVVQECPKRREHEDTALKTCAAHAAAHQAWERRVAAPKSDM